MLSPAATGSIPAHAGEPAPRCRSAPPPGVYPRPRGGTPRRAGRRLKCRGLSPPTRGNPKRGQGCHSRGRSIPAHAGGTLKRKNGWSSITGLSPPTRGNHARRRILRSPLRSIPAHAGGTFVRPAASIAGVGLSPPTRGNHFNPRRAASRHRSIPAHAGEPRSTSRTRKPPKVYPRPRGGTAVLEKELALGRGLSPPTRGNPNHAGGADAAGGSIPAHAGEPAPARADLGARGVYPRPRGGTVQ